MGAVTITGGASGALLSDSEGKPSEYVTGRPLRPSLRFGREPHDASCGRRVERFRAAPGRRLRLIAKSATGRGDTIATLAGVYPKARFVGVDVNPEHVAFASGLAEKAGLTNLRVLERDVATLVDVPDEDAPRFDYIIANGLVSWVGPCDASGVRRVRGSRLKPGGLLYVSYNALPGWAAVQPLRALLVEMTKDVEGGRSSERSAAFASPSLADGGAAVLHRKRVGRPRHSAGRCATWRLEYIVHEYFHENWRAMYFGHVAREMAAAGLHFVGQLPLCARLPRPHDPSGAPSGVQGDRQPHLVREPERLRGRTSSSGATSTCAASSGQSDETTRS